MSKIFNDLENDPLEIGSIKDAAKMYIGDARTNGKKVSLWNFNASSARAVAAEIIACADRIEGKDKPEFQAPRHTFRVGDKVRMVHPPRGADTYTGVGTVTRLHETDHDVYVDFNGYEASGHQSTFILVSRANMSGEPTSFSIPSTPTHSSYESLATLAKAIAYLPPSLRDELNALLAVKLREALK